VITAMLQNLFTSLKRIFSASASKPNEPLPQRIENMKPSALQIEYSHWKFVPIDLWRWPNFAPKEVASKGDGSIVIHEETLDKMQALRIAYGKPLFVTSWYRDPVHNAKVGGSKNSMHLKGQAVDISNKGHDCKALYKAAKAAGFTGFGFYNTFLHVDTGRARTWGKAASKYV